MDLDKFCVKTYHHNKFTGLSIQLKDIKLVYHTNNRTHCDHYFSKLTIYDIICINLE